MQTVTERQIRAVAEAIGHTSPASIAKLRAAIESVPAEAPALTDEQAQAMAASLREKGFALLPSTLADAYAMAVATAPPETCPVCGNSRVMHASYDKDWRECRDCWAKWNEAARK